MNAKCDDCGKAWATSELREIRHYTERVDVGGTVPAGECPDCGACCYDDGVKGGGRVSPAHYGVSGDLVFRGGPLRLDVANTAVIAAAPDMLAVLEEARAHLEAFYNGTPLSNYHAMMERIAAILARHK